jgi:hypothetical protein
VRHPFCGASFNSQSVFAELVYSRKKFSNNIVAFLAFTPASVANAINGDVGCHSHPCFFFSNVKHLGIEVFSLVVRREASRV